MENVQAVSLVHTVTHDFFNLCFKLTRDRTTQCVKVDARCKEKIDTVAIRKRGQKVSLNSGSSFTNKKTTRTECSCLAHGCGVYSRCEVDLVSQCGGTGEWRSAHLGTTCLIETLTEAVYIK